MLFTLTIQTNGQPAIRTDRVELHTLIAAFDHFRNDGFALTTRPYDENGSTGETTKNIAAVVRAYDPTARVRCYKSKVTVRHPAVLTAEYAALEATWQALAAGGASHHEAQNAMINEPVFRNSAFRA